MRLPIPDAITAYNWLTFGNWVDVYYRELRRVQLSPRE
jgi:hypothetical protein